MLSVPLRFRRFPARFRRWVFTLRAPPARTRGDEALQRASLLGPLRADRAIGELARGIPLVIVNLLGVRTRVTSQWHPDRFTEIPDDPEDDGLYAAVGQKLQV